MRLARGGGPLERLPIRVRQHQHVAGSALLGHHGHQSVGPEPDLRQPVGLGHREKVPEPRAIVKNRCGSLSCWGFHPHIRRPEPPHVTRALARWTLLVGVLATAACGNDDPNTPGTVDCSSVAPDDPRRGPVRHPRRRGAGLRADPGGRVSGSGISLRRPVGRRHRERERDRPGVPAPGRPEPISLGGAPGPGLAATRRRPPPPPSTTCCGSASGP